MFIHATLLMSHLPTAQSLFLTKMLPTLFIHLSQFYQRPTLFPHQASQFPNPPPHLTFPKPSCVQQAGPHTTQFPLPPSHLQSSSHLSSSPANATVPRNTSDFSPTMHLTSHLSIHISTARHRSTVPRLHLNPPLSNFDMCSVIMRLLILSNKFRFLFSCFCVLG